ncbi:MAG TPA: amino acid permease [Saprospiraceae bacterium]|nr:amino acid permease [Saprospiraceae bacterium]
MKKDKYKIGARTAMALVISSMVGTGVFTSLGFQLAEVQNTWSIILLWVVGGGIALIGAITYAELGTHFTQSGGDYIFLSRSFHPIVGYLYAWTSLTVGFSAPVAIAALAMSDYLATPLDLGAMAKWIGPIVIIMLSVIQSTTLKTAGTFQDLSSLLKVLFVLALILIGVVFSTHEAAALDFSASWTHEVWKPGFAVSLIYVSYAYQGWNQSAYIVEEIRNPLKNLPISLIGGTLLVTLLYVCINLVMLKHATQEQLIGQADVATISFGNILGSRGVYWISTLIALQLLATISSYIWIGSRVTQAMASEHPLWKPLAKKSKTNIPVRAIWFQTIISLALILVGSLEQVMLYAGFLLQITSTLTILSVFFIKPKPGTYKSPFGRKLQVIYILFSIIVTIYILYERPFESISGLTILAVGLLSYFIKPKKSSLSH